MIIFVFKIVFTRAQGSCATCYLTDFNKTLPAKGSTPKFKRQSGFCFGFFPGGYRIYEAFTAMVFNQLL